MRKLFAMVAAIFTGGVTIASIFGAQGADALIGSELNPLPFFTMCALLVRL